MRPGKSRDQVNQGMVNQGFTVHGIFLNTILLKEPIYSECLTLNDFSKVVTASDGGLVLLTVLGCS